MTTELYSHPVCIDHDAGASHPERPDRLRAVIKSLSADSFGGLVRRQAPKAGISDLELVHSATHVEDIFSRVPDSGHARVDADTAMSPKSGEAALRAAGAVTAAVDAVLNGRADNAFCAIRPPGHHAEPDRAMGFCLFNNIAIGARHAQVSGGARRVAVVDFDVHHGNGTQAAFQDRQELFYASSHQSPCYPGTGLESETGRYDNIVNVPLPPGSGSESFRVAYDQRILPALRAWRPDFLLISAGFDGHARDPLAQLNLHRDDFAWVTRQLLAVADDCCGGRVVSVLEGGYDLTALAAGVAVHVEALMVAPTVRDY